MLHVHVVLLGAVLCLCGLTPRARATLPACHRWNCPCPGDAESREAANAAANSHSLGKRIQVIYDRARHTRNRTQSLLDRIERERFLGNPHHVNNLRACVDRRSNVCRDSHLNGQCNMSGLPLVARLRLGELQADMTGVNEFLQGAQTVLASIAVYVEQAREDELTASVESLYSLVDDIRQIEEEGIYFILCDMRLLATEQNLAWLPDISRSLMSLGCRVFSDRAPQDNRNYMVFYTLEKLLHNISLQLERIKKWSHTKKNKSHFKKKKFYPMHFMI